MQHLVNDIRCSVENRTWYTALTSALALPDIGANLEAQPGGVGARYRREQPELFRGRRAVGEYSFLVNI
jgi:hypothetical protein